jgi:uncharacterized RmlC-like cupin family protein
LDNAKRVVLIDKDTVGAEEITFAYCKFEAKTSAHKKQVHKDVEGVIYILEGRVLAEFGRGSENETSGTTFASE